MVCDVVAPLGSATVRVLSPTASPVTRPSYCPLARRPNWLVTSLVPNCTLICCTSVPGGNPTATSASPPEIRSARLESTEIVGSPAADRAAPIWATAGATKAVAASTTTTPRRARTLFTATLHIPPESQFDRFVKVPAPVHRHYRDRRGSEQRPRRRSPAVVHLGDRHHGDPHRGSRQHGAQRRHPNDPARLPHDAP